MYSVTSNAVFNATKKYSGGTAIINPTYVTAGSIDWVKVGKIVIVNITNLILTEWSDGDKTIATGLPPAQIPIRADISALNSSSPSQLFAVQTNGRLDTNGGSSYAGSFYGSFVYISED